MITSNFKPSLGIKVVLPAARLASLVMVSFGAATNGLTAPLPLDTGFNPTNAGEVKYLPLAPKEATRPQQVNAPLGLREAHRIATLLGFDRTKVLSKGQYAKYMAGLGRPPGYSKADAQKAAQLTRLAVEYLGNTTGNTYTRIIDGEKVTINLGSYGLIVDRKGMLRVPANCPDPSSPDFTLCSPVRLINWVLAPDAICNYQVPPPGIPCGYMGAWMRHNNARDTLKELYTSAYAREAPFASQSQELAGIAQLIYVDKADAGIKVVGVPVAPAMWFTNFLLIYALSPDKAALMPAHWAAIPSGVATAIEGSSMGQVHYRDYQQFFELQPDFGARIGEYWR